MCEGNPESFSGLAGQCAARSIGNGAGNHHGPATAAIGKNLLDGDNGGFGIERIENRFDQDDVGATIDQAVGSFFVIGDQLVKCDVTSSRIVYIR